MDAVLTIPVVTGRINRRFNVSIPHNRMWRTIVALGLGEQRRRQWFLRAEDEDALAQALGLLAPKSKTGG